MFVGNVDLGVVGAEVVDGETQLVALHVKASRHVVRKGWIEALLQCGGGGGGGDVSGGGGGGGGGDVSGGGGGGGGGGGDVSGDEGYGYWLGISDDNNGSSGDAIGGNGSGGNGSGGNGSGGGGGGKMMAAFFVAVMSRVIEMVVAEKIERRQRITITKWEYAFKPSKWYVSTNLTKELCVRNIMTTWWCMER